MIVKARETYSELQKVWDKWSEMAEVKIKKPEQVFTTEAAELEWVCLVEELKHHLKPKMEESFFESILKEVMSHGLDFDEFYAFLNNRRLQ